MFVLRVLFQYCVILSIIVSILVVFGMEMDFMARN